MSLSGLCFQINFLTLSHSGSDLLSPSIQDIMLNGHVILETVCNLQCKARGHKVEVAQYQGQDCLTQPPSNCSSLYKSTMSVESR